MIFIWLFLIIIDWLLYFFYINSGRYSLHLCAFGCYVVGIKLASSGWTTFPIISFYSSSSFLLSFSFLFFFISFSFHCFLHIDKKVSEGESVDFGKWMERGTVGAWTVRAGLCVAACILPCIYAGRFADGEKMLIGKVVCYF